MRIETCYCIILHSFINFFKTVDSEDQVILQGPGPLTGLVALTCATPAWLHHWPTCRIITCRCHFIKSLPEMMTPGGVGSDSVSRQWNSHCALLAVRLLLSPQSLLLAAAVLQEHGGQVAQTWTLRQGEAQHALHDGFSGDVRS